MTNIYSDGELFLSGVVGVDPFENFFTAAQIREALAEHGSRPLRALLNSPGGSVGEAVEIYHTLKSHRAPVEIIITGIAASAGSLIAMAGAETVMRRGTTLMLHDPSVSSFGTAADHKKSAEALEKIAAEMASIYAARSGRSVAAVRQLMINETWYTSDEAVRAGFADRVDDLSEAGLIAASSLVSKYGHPPARVVAQAQRSRAMLHLHRAVAMTNHKFSVAPKPKALPPEGRLSILAAAVTRTNHRLGGGPKPRAAVPERCRVLASTNRRGVSRG